MKLTVISSGSAGNCYVLGGRRSALIIECGVAPERVFKATDVVPSKVAGCLVSHEHGDHAGFVGRYAALGITVYASEGTLHALEMRRGCSPLRVREAKQVGEWVVKPFRVFHDAAEPLGFIIEHPECGKVLFVTDTKFVTYSFRLERIDHIMVEANYSDDIIDDNILADRLSMDRAARVRQTHMSLRSAIELVRANETPALKTVVLLHLSSGNADPDLFARETRKSARLAQVYVATAGLTIELNKNEI